MDTLDPRSTLVDRMRAFVADASDDREELDSEQQYAARWRRVLLIAIPIGALAFMLGWILGDPNDSSTPIDRWAYPLMSLAMVLLELLLARHRRYLRIVVLAIIGGSSTFFLLKLLFLLQAADAGTATIQGELTETFFWVPVVYLLSFILPTARMGRIVTATFTAAMLLTSLLYIVPRWGTGMDVGAIHALIQLNLANGVFLPLTMAFISFREHHTRTRTRMETAERFAYVDALTGLPNRLQLQRHLDQCLARAQREGGYVGILFIDLDGFKVINDTLGHAVGDELLSAFGQHLLATRRASDFAARISGDEFVLVLEGLDSPDGARVVAQRLQAELVRPLQSSGHDHHITLSIGISVFPDDGEDATTLLRHADSAMYRVKRAGRNGIEVYSEDADEAMERLRWIEHDLHAAIGTDQIRLVYQPLHDLESGEMIAVEALLRWQHPQHGHISPGEFVPVAESSGQIIALGGWVLDEACRQAKAWERRSTDGPRVLINVSPLQFAQPDFFRQVADALERHALSPEKLGIEITESVVLQGAAHITTTLEQLRRLGVDVAIDDFGTGYSSLAYLRDLPIDTIKIDRSFIRDLGEPRNEPQFALALVEAILSIAEYLDLTVVAEGIETERQRALLTRLGCHVGQGYHFAKPLRPDELDELLGVHVPTVQQPVSSLVN